jgi:hypothetical protein
MGITDPKEVTPGAILQGLFLLYPLHHAAHFPRWYWLIL